MSQSKQLDVIGGIILLFGLMVALISNHYQSKVMGDASLGVAVIAPEKDSPEWKEKISMRAWSNIGFYVGTVLTAIGIILQTLGTWISVKEREKKHKLKIFWKHQTTIWIFATVIVMIVSIFLYFLAEKGVDYLTMGEVIVLGLTAISLFLYARDTKRIADLTHEDHYQPMAHLSVKQGNMPHNHFFCSLQMQLLRPIPFIAKIDLRLEIGGKKIAK